MKNKIIILFLTYLILNSVSETKSCEIPEFLDLNYDKKIDGYDWILIPKYKNRYNLVFSIFIKHYGEPKTIEQLYYVKEEIDKLTISIDNFYFVFGKKTESLDKAIHIIMKKHFSSK